MLLCPPHLLTSLLIHHSVLVPILVIALLVALFAVPVPPMMSSQSLSGLDGAASGSNPAHGPRSGLKGRLRRALWFNAVQTLKEEDEDDHPPSKSSKKKEKGKDVRIGPVVDADDDADDAGEEAASRPGRPRKVCGCSMRVSTRLPTTSLCLRLPRVLVS